MRRNNLKKVALGRNCSVNEFDIEIAEKILLDTDSVGTLLRAIQILSNTPHITETGNVAYLTKDITRRGNATVICRRNKDDSVTIAKKLVDENLYTSIILSEFDSVMLSTRLNQRIVEKFDRDTVLRNNLEMRVERLERENLNLKDYNEV